MFLKGVGGGCIYRLCVSNISKARSRRQQRGWRSCHLLTYFIYEGRRIMANHGRIRNKNSRECPQKCGKERHSKTLGQESGTDQATWECEMKNRETDVQRLCLLVWVREWQTREAWQAGWLRFPAKWRPASSGRCAVRGQISVCRAQKRWKSRQSADLGVTLVLDLPTGSDLQFVFARGKKP